MYSPLKNFGFPQMKINRNFSILLIKMAEGGLRMGSVTVVEANCMCWIIQIEVDVRSSHQDVDAPHVHKLLYQDLHAGIQQRKETNVIIIVKFLLLYQFRYLKPERNLRNSTSCCIMCYLLAFMGFGFKVAQSQLYKYYCPCCLFT